MHSLLLICFISLLVVGCAGDPTGKTSVGSGNGLTAEELKELEKAEGKDYY